MAEKKVPDSELSLAEAGALLNEMVAKAMEPVTAAVEELPDVVALAFLTRMARACEDERIRYLAAVAQRNVKGTEDGNG